MSGLGLVLSIAKDALAAQQYGINVTGHNIANVNTPGFSRQTVVYEAKEPAPYGGVLLGRGVDTTDVLRANDQFIENRLMQQKSTMFSSKEMENYMQVLESLFSEDSEMSISAMLSDFWNSWHDIANNPSRAPERIALYEHSILLSEQFNNLDADLRQLEMDLTGALSAGTERINQITSEIAQLNDQIAGMEIGRIANDLRDKRNTLISELSEYLDVKSFEQSNGSITVLTAKGCAMVHGNDSYELEMGGDYGDRVLWEGSGGSTVDITDYISNGKLGGWLDMRDDVVAKYKLDLDALAEEFIWTLNQQHSQGVGIKLFGVDLTGTYKTDSSGLLSTLTYGQKIDYTKDFRMWIDNGSGLTDVTVDMGISSASLTDWAGTATGATQYKYAFTVTTAGTVGADANVTETDGVGLGVVQTGADVSDALDSAIAAQTITVAGGAGGDQTVSIADSGADATRSAKDIARALSALIGVTAYASDNSATIDISNLLHDVQEAHENDVVSFTLSSGGSTANVSFTVSSTDATTRSSFLIALNSAITTINGTGSDLSIDGSKLASDNLVTITSASGENIGIEDFDVDDNATITIDNFDEDGSGAANATFDLAGITITFMLDETTQSGAAQHLMDGLDASSVALATAGISYKLNAAGDGVVITGTGEAGLDITNLVTTGSNDGGFDVGCGDGTLVSGAENNKVTLDGAGGGNPNNTAVAPNIVETDTMAFGTGTLTESGAGDSGVKTGTITVFLEPDLTIKSSIAAGVYSLFNVGADTAATTGNSIITLGGDGGFTGFNYTDAANFDTISFDVDGTTVSYEVGVDDDTDVEFATGLFNELNAALGANYSVSKNGASVSIIKNTGDTPIEITDFADNDGSGAGNSATLAVSTGTGVGAPDPANTLLDASDSAKTSATSTLYGSEGVISWKKFDDAGAATGASGTISVDDADQFTDPLIVDGLTFDIGAGTLVGGNTFTINTDDTGAPDKLVLTASGSARSVLDTYTFSVTTGGTIGTNTPEIGWSNGTTSGTVTVTATGSYTVDGMTLSFTSGTLFTGDTFTITTDADGTPTANLPSAWHWTLESFKDQFNSQATGKGVTASATSYNTLAFSPNSGYSFGFCDHNYGDSGLLAALGINTFFEGRSAGSIGMNEQIENKDYIAAGKINNNVGLAVPAPGNTSTGSITTAGPYTGVSDATYTIRIEPGGATFTWKKDDGEWSALPTDISVDSSQTINQGVALTFSPGTYVGGDTFTMAVTASPDPSLAYSIGDNTNALAITNLQHTSMDISHWTCDRIDGNTGGSVTSTIENYYHSVVGSMGIKASSVERSNAFNEIMVEKLSGLRDSISAVSLDEEMTNLIKFQYAYQAAAKLISVSDELLNTLLSVK